jgi:hypothetical protein
MNEYYEVPKNSPYYGFDALLAQKKNTFYDFFRKNLPSLKTIKNANT